MADVWGIGRRSVSKLNYYGVHTAYDLVQRSESWVRKMLTISGVRTWRELHGESCIDIEELPQEKEHMHEPKFLPMKACLNLVI